ncbi:C-x(9)-C motif containing 4 homolog (S. cerevisiae) [Nesidiocoris tenuis]|uniref:C-x(9)-C motif containing 4 homolog (S. cerevisiae) n=1 Tax=Nesidiocoris tenuis TaxID=355587 RepID=A0ABN7B8S1_9HEMI|nr:C-x(9)-C motif containing 4 homolog (S. cerevisiae) [Nesidiocoris tenuis]
MKPKDPCKPHACNIQKCLKENNFQEDKCLQFIEYLRECCVKFGPQSISCSGIDTSKVRNNVEGRPQ